MKKYKLLLFDLDDTLLNSDWFKTGLIQTISEHPLTKNVDAALFLEKKLSIPSHLIERLKNREFKPPEFRKARWKHAFAHFDIRPDDELINEIETLFLQKGFSSIVEDPSLIQLLKELNKHYELGIVTNALYDPREKIFQMGLSKVFPKETIFCGEKLGLRKPDRDLYYAPLKYYGRKPEETLFIGDSWLHDVAGPIDLGMEAIWINTHGTAPLTDHSPYAIVSNVSEIRNLLLNLNNKGDL